MGVVLILKKRHEGKIDTFTGKNAFKIFHKDELLQSV